MLSLILRALLGRDGSLAALALILAEGLTPSTTVAWSIASAAVVGAVGVGITVGIFRHKVETLLTTVAELKTALAKERDLRKKSEDTWDTHRTDTHGRLIKLETLSESTATTKSAAGEIVAAIDKLGRRSDSPRPRDHDSTRPRSR